MSEETETHDDEIQEHLDFLGNLSHIFHKIRNKERTLLLLEEKQSKIEERIKYLSEDERYKELKESIKTLKGLLEITRGSQTETLHRLHHFFYNELG